MKKSDPLDAASKACKLWTPDVDPQKSQINFITPQDYIEANPMYEKREFLALGFGHLEEYSDAETGQPQVRFMRNIEIEDAQELIDEVTSFLRQLRKSIAIAVQPEDIEKIDSKNNPQRFWKLLIDLNEELAGMIDKEEVEINVENSGHGPHVRIETKDNRSILRIKARTLKSLCQLTKETFIKIQKLI